MAQWRDFNFAFETGCDTFTPGSPGRFGGALTTGPTGLTAGGEGPVALVAWFGLSDKIFPAFQVACLGSLLHNHD